MTQEAVDLEQKCVCGHPRGQHRSDGTRPCHAIIQGDGQEPPKEGAFTGKTCGCEQFVAEAEVVEDPLASTEVVKWADTAMYEAEPMPVEDGRIVPQVTLLSATPDPLGVLAAACNIYKGRVIRNLADITDEERRHFWEEMQKTALDAPLETIQLHFLIEGVTREFTHQIVRQRTAFFAQESLRFAVKDNMAMEVPFPPSIDPDSPQGLVWANFMQDAETNYNALVNAGVPAEDARGVLPHATTTRLHYVTNMRGLLMHAGLRLCTQAQFEWRVVFAKIVQAIREHNLVQVKPKGDGHSKYQHDRWQWEHIADSAPFRPICYKTGQCQFGADFDRHCSIRDRVNEGRFEEINPAEWLANHAAAREQA